MDSQERRTAPRLEVLNQLHGQLVGFHLRQTVREIGPGGFSTEGFVEFRVGARHHFRFTTAIGRRVVLEASVAHSRPANSNASPLVYITGFAFVHDGTHDTDADIGILLDAMTAALEFEEVV